MFSEFKILTLKGTSTASNHQNTPLGAFTRQQTAKSVLKDKKPSKHLKTQNLTKTRGRP